MLSFQNELDLIKQEFIFLFSEYDYVIVYKKKYREDHYSIGLESPLVNCRIWFGRERSPRWGMFLGNRQTPFNDSINDWTFVTKILSNLGCKPNYNDLKNKPYYEQVRNSIEILAQTVEPVFDQIIESFTNSNKL